MTKVGGPTHTTWGRVMKTLKLWASWATFIALMALVAVFGAISASFLGLAWLALTAAQWVAKVTGVAP